MEKSEFYLNTFVQEVKTDPRDTLTVEVGDAKQLDFKPQFKLMRWDNEVNFSIRAEEHPDATVELEGEKIKYITPEYEVHQYEKPDAFEFEWLLKVKPDSNILSTTIQSKGLTFHYQDEVELRKEGDVTIPENVKGSYAVYHQDLPRNYVGGNLYRSGKVFHIFRPKATDNLGNEVWCDIYVSPEEGKLSVIVPKDFIDNAAYPILVDPTFGYSTQGASSVSKNSTFQAIGSLNNSYTAATGDTVTKFSVYAGSAGPGAVAMDMAVYSIVTSLPNTRLSAGVNISFTAVGWHDSAGVSQALTNGTNYNVAQGNYTGADNTNAFFDSLGGTNRSQATTTGALPASWTNGSTGAAAYSMYATYTAGGVTNKGFFF